MAPASDRRPWKPLLGATAIAVVIVGLAAVALLVAADGPELTPSGVVATQKRPVTAFTGVELRGVGRISVTAGRPRSVVVRADTGVLEHVTTRVSQGVLVVGLEGDARVSELQVTVAVPRLDRLTLSGSGEIDARGTRGDRLRVGLSGAGLVRADGAVTRLDAVLSGVGDVRLGDLRARTVTARIDGTGRVVVHPTRSLRATVTGAGEILYRGDPARVRTTVTGAGAVVRSPGSST